MEIKVRNINQAFSEFFWRLRALNLAPEPSRNGPVLAMPEPVITTYARPRERVLFHAGRDCNPVFHLMESIWMLAGARDVAFPQMFNSGFGQYSDDGFVFNAAYGYRWRQHFGRDQLLDVIELLRRDPTTRQAVLQMWDPADLTKNTRDKACNLCVIFDCRDGRLNMTVYNRSNDAWYGAYGANAVHMSFLQEFVTCAVEREVGVYRQVSNNLHLYTQLYDASAYLDNPPDPAEYDGYAAGNVSPAQIMLTDDYRAFLADCERFCEHPFDPDARYAHSFFLATAHPMAMVSRARRLKLSSGLEYAERIQAPDWRLATQQWVQRRELKNPIGNANLI